MVNHIYQTRIPTLVRGYYRITIYTNYIVYKGAQLICNSIGISHCTNTGKWNLGGNMKKNIAWALTNDLPDEMLLMVFNRLSIFDRFFTLVRVCDGWKNLLATDKRMPGEFDHCGLRLRFTSCQAEQDVSHILGRGPVRQLFQIVPHSIWERVMEGLSRKPHLERGHDLALSTAVFPWLRDRLRTLVISSRKWRDGYTRSPSAGFRSRTSVT